MIAILFVIALAGSAFAQQQEFIQLLATEGAKLRQDMINLFNAEQELNKVKADLTKELQGELDKLIPKLKQAEDLIKKAIAANTEEDEVIQWALQAELDRLTLLDKDLTELQAILKKSYNISPGQPQTNTTNPDHNAEDLAKIRADIRTIVAEVERLNNDLNRRFRQMTAAEREAERKEIVADIEKAKTQIAAAEKLIEAEIAKGGDARHLFELRTEEANLRALQRNLQRLENRLGGAPAGGFDEDDDVYQADPNLQQLEAQIRELINEAFRDFATLLQKEIEGSKKIQDLQNQLIKDIDAALPKIHALEDKLNAELAKATDDLIIFMLETERDTLAVLEKELAALEKRIKEHGTTIN